MAPSQLKQLKASLKDHGILGPQKSKKVRKANAKDGQKRLQRNAALHGIRERFNPFEIKGPARKEKFEVASNKPGKPIIERPGVSRSLGEERRRETLLKEMRSKNKVGGMVDRRFGENDPTMTPEERAAERFAKQALRASKKNSMFNLEDDSDEEMVLTHGGRSLDFGNDAEDDFNEGDLEDDFGVDNFDDRPTKRLRLDNEASGSEEDESDAQDAPERRKTKNEVMKEIIAKSKMYKAERQAAKADDDDLRAELDKGMNEFYEALQNHKVPVKQQLPSPPNTDSEPPMDPGRAAMLAGKSREEAEKEYEANLRQLKLEARSKPSVRTKTEEEKAAEQAAKLEELERKRLRRMRGEPESSDDESMQEVEVIDDADRDDAKAFGLTQPQYHPRPPLEVEDEDEFVLDDIIASNSEAEMASDDDDDDDDSAMSSSQIEDDGDDDFINGLVLPRPVETKVPKASIPQASTNLAYTFDCPQTHRELLSITETTKLADLPTIVQRIRALHHKGLAPENQVKLGKFASVLVTHIAYLVDNHTTTLPYSVPESLLRHLHSMAKTQPEDVGLAFRNHLRLIAESRPLSLSAGDLVLLTGISTIFPTSDHFHAVTTPAMLTLARYLGQSTVQNLQDLARGAYSCSLSIKYQQTAQRYVPEVVTYIVNALAILSPTPLPPINRLGHVLNVPLRPPEQNLRLQGAKPVTTLSSKLSFDELRDASASASDPATLLHVFMLLAEEATKLWEKKTAFPELASSLLHAVDHLITPSCKEKLPKEVQKTARKISNNISSMITLSIGNRKPLLLHNHRPLAIKTSVPHFIENFNPDRHYDPDRDRAELSKLKAEHKKERKGAMRELRKDANFIAREQLREKKAKDEAYDKKFKRLVAEIQGEEGREAKEYEREKKRRKGRM